VVAHWFEDSVNPAVVTQFVRAAVPELADGRMSLIGCRVTRIRSVPQTQSWTAIYELELQDNHTGLERTFATQGLLTSPDAPMPVMHESAPFGCEGWTLVIPELRLQLEAVAFDESLPGLTAIMNPEIARSLVASALADRAGDQPGAPTLSSCESTIVSEKPGVRATIISRLTYIGDATSADWPEAVVVKVHHDDEGLRAYAVLQALARSGLASSTSLGIARPVAYVPELRMSIQEYVPHEGTLKDLFSSTLGGGSAWSGLVAALRETGAGLAALHRCGSTHGDIVTFADEFATLRSKYAKLSAVLPELEDRLGPAIERIATAALRTPEDPVVVVHHSFRPDQVLLDGRVSFIDLDKSCRSEPGSDIAALSTKLLHMGVNKVATPSADEYGHRIDQLRELRSAFLTEYERHAPVSRDRLVMWEAYEFASLVLSAAKKMEPARIGSCLLLLEDHLAASDI
jgi:hypothetical protein